MNHTAIKKNRNRIKVRKLIIASVLIGFLSAFLALALKRLTEYYESIFLQKADNSLVFFLVFPILGLSVIYLLRDYLFNKKPNKGITEIFESTKSKNKNLPV